MTALGVYCPSDVHVLEFALILSIYSLEIYACRFLWKRLLEKGTTLETRKITSLDTGIFLRYVRYSCSGGNCALPLQSEMSLGSQFLAKCPVWKFPSNVSWRCMICLKGGVEILPVEHSSDFSYLSHNGVRGLLTGTFTPISGQAGQRTTRFSG